MSTPRVDSALRSAAGLGLDRLDAQLLLLHALGRSPSDRAWLLAHDHEPLTEDLWSACSTLFLRRAAGEPVAYLVGEKEFFGLPLRVDARVLVPRPDTETLVAWALDLLPVDSNAAVLDLGTGSGAIALAVANERRGAAVDAVDASEGALAVAAANAERLGIPIRLTHANWWHGAPADEYDLVVSNPPYIAEDDPHMADLSHEPRSALTAGADGLDDIRAIVAGAMDRLAPGGWLLLEHGWNQAAAVRALLADAGLEEVQSRPDLAGIERCSGGRRAQHG